MAFAKAKDDESIHVMASSCISQKLSVRFRPTKPLLGSLNPTFNKY